jgi:Zn-dependent peptidase ImmA (M78 family)/DNA-binding XRE family transcriptional regulator
LQRARKTAGLSLRALGGIVGLTHAAIKRYEDGEVSPSSSMIIKLSDVLNVRPEYFFMSQDINLQAVKYRQCYGLSKKQLELIQLDIINQVEQHIALKSLFPSPPMIAFALPQNLPDHINDFKQIDDLTKIIRQYWDLGMNPISYFIDILELHGIYVVITHVAERYYKKFDGLTAWIDEIPIIVMDKNWPGDHQRFTLAHELGHIFLANRFDEKLDKELACHYFAGALLLPESIAKQILGTYRTNIELNELAMIKQKFGLSMMATLYRANNLNILPLPSFKKQLRLFKKNNWHIHEPGDAYPAEKNQIFEQLIFRALGEGYIDENKAAELMKIPNDQFHKIRNTLHS